mgnify:CR=1 FL=1
MPWYTSDRRGRLPRDWDRIRTRVLARAAYQCQAITHDPRCDGRATDVDHIHAGDDHSLDNLQALSAVCHRAKTARESIARNHARARMRLHPAEPHPGCRHGDGGVPHFHCFAPTAG